MSDLAPGPELDALVAERVMGWTWEEVGTSQETWADGQIHNHYVAHSWVGPGAPKMFSSTKSPHGFSPSTNIAHAWEVVERLVGETPMELFGSQEVVFRVEFVAGWFEALFRQPGTTCPGDGGLWALDRQNTAPHAICLAALRAVE